MNIFTKSENKQTAVLIAVLIGGTERAQALIKFSIDNAAVSGADNGRHIRGTFRGAEKINIAVFKRVNALFSCGADIGKAIVADMRDRIRF